MSDGELLLPWWNIRVGLGAQPLLEWCGREEGVVDNEGLGRKSSKRCCIFHKQRDFGESSTDSSDVDSDGSSSESSGGPPKKVSKPKGKGKIAGVKKGKVPDHQRFHA
jgi:protein phosphatase 1 regulatory subunit 11